jgi:putative Mg2+ transporter-C (MgtC) family protein
LQESPKESALPKVKGLTTSASVWISAGLGAAIGCGLWQMGLMAGFLTLVTLSGVKRLSRAVGFRGSREEGRNVGESSDIDDEF